MNGPSGARESASSSSYPSWAIWGSMAIPLPVVGVIALAAGGSENTRTAVSVFAMLTLGAGAGLAYRNARWYLAAATTGLTGAGLVLLLIADRDARGARSLFSECPECIIHVSTGQALVVLGTLAMVGAVTAVWYAMLPRSDT